MVKAKAIAVVIFSTCKMLLTSPERSTCQKGETEITDGAGMPTLRLCSQQLCRSMASSFSSGTPINPALGEVPVQEAKGSSSLLYFFIKANSSLGAIPVSLRPAPYHKLSAQLSGTPASTSRTQAVNKVVVESNKVSPQPPLPQFPQELLIRLVVQTLHQLRCPSLDTLQHLNVSLVVRGPKLNTVFEPDAIGFLGHLGTLLAHVQPAVNQHLQVLLCQAAFQPLFPKPVALHGVAVAQVQDSALGLVEPHTIDLSPSTQPVQIPLQSLPTLKQINSPAQFGVICKLTEGTLNPLIQIIDKDIKQDWPEH
ncbi:hypothetical protein QYF61_012775 [Mycteria americana]|uniref:Uncharacterized protein n=1 Tax=Mycteria americana TaxID=33587 RepID=A0AAN7S6X7_MYCAM|nr:hypothetical protein QYF61_012775 [Mycteria americana]